MPFQQSRVAEHAIDAGRADRHDIGVEHHEGQPAIAFQRMLAWKSMIACFSQSSSQQSRGTSALCSLALP